MGTKRAITRSPKAYTNLIEGKVSNLYVHLNGDESVMTIIASQYRVRSSSTSIGLANICICSPLTRCHLMT
jgi:hypothetical protein